MVDIMELRKKYPQKRRPGVKKVNKTNKICSIVTVLVNYLDNIITIIFQKFQTLVTSINGKLILVSGKTCFEIIKQIDKRH